MPPRCAFRYRTGTAPYSIKTEEPRVSGHVSDGPFASFAQRIRVSCRHYSLCFPTDPAAGGGAVGGKENGTEFGFPLSPIGPKNEGAAFLSLLLFQRQIISAPCVQKS